MIDLELAKEQLDELHKEVTENPCARARKKCWGVYLKGKGYAHREIAGVVRVVAVFPAWPRKLPQYEPSICSFFGRYPRFMGRFLRPLRGRMRYSISTGGVAGAQPPTNS